MATHTHTHTMAQSLSDSLSMDANPLDKWMWTQTVTFFASWVYTLRAVPFLLFCWSITTSVCQCQHCHILSASKATLHMHHKNNHILLEKKLNLKWTILVSYPQALFCFLFFVLHFFFNVKMTIHIQKSQLSDKIWKIVGNTVGLVAMPNQIVQTHPSSRLHSPVDISENALDVHFPDRGIDHWQLNEVRPQSHQHHTSTWSGGLQQTTILISTDLAAYNRQPHWSVTDLVTYNRQPHWSVTDLVA